MNTDATRNQQSRWLPSLVRQQGNFLLAIPVACLVTSLTAFSWLQINTVKAQYLVRHTQQVRLEAKRLLTALLDAESGVRGYELTARREFLAGYETSITLIPQSLEKLTQLVVDNPSQTQRIQQIRELSKARLTLLENLRQLVSTQPETLTRSPKFTAQVIESKRAMDKTREQIELFLAEEQRLQINRDTDLRQQQQLIWLVLSLSAGIGIGGSVLAAYLMNRLNQKLTERDRKLRESEARYRVLIENFPNGAVVLFSPELCYLIANGTGLATVGLSKGQLEGKTIWELFPPETCSVLEPIYREALSGRATTAEIPYAGRIYLMYALPVRNESGETYAGMVMTQDITERKQAEEQLRESEERYRQLVELCPDGIFIQSQGKFAFLNRAAIKLYNAANAEELIGKSVLDFVHPEHREIVKERIRQLGEDVSQVPLIEEKWFRLDGTVFHAEVTAIPFIYHNEPAAQVVVRDISERKQSERQLAQVNRALKTLSECNQALIRATDEPTLLQDICRKIVKFGGYRAVWIAFAEQDEAKSVRPVAQVGFDEGFLESLEITWSDTERGRGPTGTAIRTSQTSIVQNILTDPSYIPWREAAIQRGYASSIAVPLIINAKVLGTLDICATEADAFDEAEVQLLTELANDLVHGITALRTLIGRQQAEAALRESKQRLDGILSSIQDVVWSVSITTDEVLYLNQAAEKVYGRTVQEFLDNPNFWLEVVHPEDWERVNALNQATLEMGGKDIEYRILRPDGEVRWLHERSRVTHDEQGTPIRLDGIVTDITQRKQAEEALQDSETKFRAFLQSASEAIIISNANGEIVVFNAKAEELFGYADTEVLGRTIEFLMPERYHQSHVRHRAAYQAHPSKRSMSGTKNLFARRKDKTEFPIEAGLSFIKTKDGTFVMTFLTDITKRKKAEDEIRRLNESLERRAVESETRFQQIVELAEEGIWVIDSEAKTTYVNQAIERMLGYSESEMLGCYLSDFLSEPEQKRCCPLINFASLSQVERCELKLKTKTDKDVWVYMSASPALDENGKMLWSCVLVYDITERKQAEEQLRESSERISLANAELARATRLKDEFLANMSHELRTPLNAILGLSEALQEEVYGDLTPRQRKSIVTIEQSGQHLLELINDILDLSKIESGKMELEIASVSLENLCESSLTFVKQQAHQKRIKLNFKVAAGIEEIELDERRMRQVLVNLLSNAVKFTPEGGEVSLEVEADSDGESLQLSVIDTGIGIASENLNQLFKPFVQLDSSLSRRYAGTGLGLALVRRIVEIHGGSISVESEVGQGSRFTINLPWKEPDRITPYLEEREPENVELPIVHKALIVEDSETAARQIARYLAELGAAVEIHPQGEGTIEAALKYKPDLIILDLLLPHLSGWEVLDQLKANPATQHIPVLVVSVVDERSQAMALGASDYLLKPISRQQLHSALNRILPESSQRNNGEAGMNFLSTALDMNPQNERQLPLILLAEDNEANISTMMDYLQLHEFRVRVARNGVEAVQMAKQEKPDLILMDIQMPQMDGLEATRQIRAEADLATIPIIALTALAMPGDQTRCKAAGATDYLTKPVGLKKLTHTIAQHINSVANG